MTMGPDTEEDIVSLSLDEFRESIEKDTLAMPRVQADMKFHLEDLKLTSYYNGSGPDAKIFSLRLKLGFNSQEVDPTLTTASQSGTRQIVDIEKLEGQFPKITYNVDDRGDASILFEVFRGAESDKNEIIRVIDKIVLTASAETIEILKSRLKEVNLENTDEKNRASKAA